MHLVEPATRRPASRTLSSAAHVLEALQVVSEHAQGVPIKLVARRLGISLSSAYAVIGSLLDQELVECSPTAAGLYTIGPKVAHLYAGYVAARNRPERFQPVAERLRDRAAARSYVGVWKDGDLEISHVRGRRGACELQDVTSGFRGAAHALAMGKACLAWTPERAWPTYLRGLRSYEAFTPRTITAPQALRQELATVHRQRIALDVEEFRSGICCVAAPVLDSASRLVAVIGASVSARRFLQERDALVAAVREVAEGCSRELPGLATPAHRTTIHPAHLPVPAPVTAAS